MENDVLTIIHELMNKEDLTQDDIFKRLPFQKRHLLVIDDFAPKFVDFCNKRGLYLFDEEEFKRIPRILDKKNILMPTDIFVKRASVIKVPPTNVNFSHLSDEELSKIIEAQLEKGKLSSEISKVQKTDTDYSRDKINAYISQIIIYLKSDDLKEKYLQEIDLKISQYEFFIDVIESFKSDSKKMELLNDFIMKLNKYIANNPSQAFLKHNPIRTNLENGFDNYKRKVFLSIKDKALVRGLAYSPSIPKAIIANIEDEEERERYFRQAINLTYDDYMVGIYKNRDMATIVSSFSSREKQLELAELFEEEDSIYYLLMSSKVLTANDKYKLAQRLKSKEYLMEVALSLDNVNLKRKLLAEAQLDYEMIEKIFVEKEVNDLGTCEVLIDSLSEYDRKALFNMIFDSSQLNICLLLLSKIEDKNFVLDAFESIEPNLIAGKTEYTISNFNLNKFCHIYADLYNLNFEHLRIFATTFGYPVFKYIEDKNIQNAINQDKESFEKYMKLFGLDSFRSSEIKIKNACFALAQKNFKMSYDGFTDFHTILVAASEGNYRLVDDTLRGYFLDFRINSEALQKFLNERINQFVGRIKDPSDHAKVLNGIYESLDQYIKENFGTYSLKRNENNELTTEELNGLINQFVSEIKDSSEHNKVLNEIYDLIDEYINENFGIYLLNIYSEKELSEKSLDELMTHELTLLRDKVLTKLTERIIERIKNPSEKSKVLSEIHDMIDKRVEARRKQFVDDNKAKFYFHICSEMSDTFWWHYYVYGQTPEKLRDDIEKSNSFNTLTDEEIIFLESDRLEKIFDYLSYSKEEPSAELKGDIKLFKSIIRKMKKPHVPISSNMTEEEQMPKYDRTKDYEYMLSIIRRIDPDCLGALFANNALYERLCKLLDSTKILATIDILQRAVGTDPIFEEKFELDEKLVTALIQEFPVICEDLNTKETGRLGLTDYLDSARMMTPRNRRYRLLLGDEDFRLIYQDQPPFQSNAKPESRLDIAARFLSKIFNREYLTIPPQDRNYNLSSGRILHVSLGDLHNINNLTLGERTGSCMRIEGMGQDLHSCCLLNENGVHLVFTDPKTGAFVSRVSGFRQGNTFVFNELRYRRDENYTNEDLIECLKMVAKAIIEETKDSEFPVENVIISPYYACESMKDEVVDLKCGHLSNGIEGCLTPLEETYTDVDPKEVIVLATSAKDEKFVPVEFGSNNPKYHGLKSKLKKYDGAKATDMVAHMKALKQYLDTGNIDDVSLEKEPILRCYASNEWCVYIDANCELKTICVIPEAEKEVEDYLGEIFKDSITK